ncbi:MAG: penicillin-binding protein 2 [Candidatus Daviesbacteria bacterium]|nr:penicillin-binding protein 2 [Candidatus Daviesbacteria bacterium]
MRIKFLKFLFLFFLFAIAVRLFYWQVFQFDDLSARAEQQHLSTRTLDAPRGEILSSDGSILVSNKPTYTLFGLPKIIKNKTETAKSLAKIIVFNESKNEEIDPKEIIDLKNDIFKKLSSDLNWVLLSKSIELSTKEELEKLKIDGIGFEEQSNRFYPESSSSAHLLGFVGSDSLGRQVGYFGIEGFYDGQLKGVGGVLTEEKDAQGLPILMGKFLQKEPKNGNNLVLNIDRVVQYIVEKKLKEGVEKFGAKNGSVIIMDPKTGAILAMASFPNYDPGDFNNFPKENFKNPIVADSYEPGSTFKVLVMAAAINENLVKNDTKCDVCAGPVKASDYLIRTWDNKYYPDTTMTDVIVHSDNTGMVFVGRKLGIDKFYQYLENFGFGSLTGVDLQDETTPDIRVKSEWRDIDLATASFGQGIAVTPMQTIRAIASIANDGFLMEPHVVKEIQNGNKILEIKPKIISRLFTSETTKIVTDMMVQAVEKGEAKYLAPKGYRIAGKTGTAQIPVAGHYDPTKTIASFVGFAPAADPKFIMLVKYQEPSSSIFGAETAAPTFFEIAKELLTYYNIAPN